MMTNAELVVSFYNILKNLHVTEVIVCAGARNAPLVVGLSNQSFQVKSYFEERSAAFYALGRAKSLNQPVAVITTSGTAAAELLPAVIEAYYQGIPLIVVTADRPKIFRGTGSPQAIEQPQLFQKYVQASYDWDVTENDLSIHFHQQKPLHFNLCFDEPLIHGDFSKAAVKSAQIQTVENALINDLSKADLLHFTQPLFIISQLSSSEKTLVKNYLIKYQVHHYAEVLSGLLGDSDLQHLQMNNCESLLTQLLEKNIFSSVIRFGGIPTLRLWRDLEKKLIQVPVLSLSNQIFSGLARHSFVLNLDNTDLMNELYKNLKPIQFDLKKLNQQLQIEKLKILSKYPRSEQNFIFELSQHLNQQPLYVGNSLPIREWDLFSQGFFPITYGNRGANGIDGQISTYLGWSQKFDQSWAVIGDLTALYDLAALGLHAPQAESGFQGIIIINNYGGQIFKKVFHHPQFLNSHKIQFEPWAQMWGWNYQQIKNISDLSKIQGDSLKKTKVPWVIEISVQQSESDAVWAELEAACKAIPF